MVSGAAHWKRRLRRERRARLPARREPPRRQRVRALRLAMEEADAHGEDRVEAPVAEIGVLQRRDEEIGRPGRDERGVAPRRRGDHRRRPVDGDEAADRCTLGGGQRLDVVLVMPHPQRLRQSALRHAR